MVHHVAWYKEFIRPIMHNGDQYLLTAAPPLDGNGDWAAVWYATRDAGRGTLFAFRLASEEREQSFGLAGLDPRAQYRLQSLDGWSAIRSGADLVSGLAVTVDAPFRALLLSVGSMMDLLDLRTGRS